ncbi:T9SS type A sorting domain-containing protein [Polluticaenibacter yanchengensis]|uniref:T9SS type A sorting domain-containing protein n=1 Tax=Polluticaenibacter yanchengensis TaxID=3014562 RepID=A0ABT4UKY4_9BACT|nr:T9SS type A sorting domain-containing protein [Chitinophagaceae bacterium LY-5]
MRKFLLFTILATICFNLFSQTPAKLYATFDKNSTGIYNGYSAARVNQRITYDDVHIPIAAVPNADSIVITAVKYRVYSRAGRPNNIIRGYIAEFKDTTSTPHMLKSQTYLGGYQYNRTAETDVNNYYYAVYFGDSTKSDRYSAVKAANGVIDPNFSSFFVGINFTADSMYWYFSADTSKSLNFFWYYDPNTSSNGTSYFDSRYAAFSVDVWGYAKTAQGSLPVTFIDVAANRSSSGNTVTWTTSSEYNNKGYYVQKSKDGSNFTDIGFIEATGNLRLQTNSYSFEDVNTDGETVFYRIKQVDVDGKESLSKVVSVEGIGANISVYPNPTSDFINVIYQVENNAKVSVQLLSSDGKILEVIDRANLAKGQYQSRLTPKAAGVYRIKIVVDGKITIKTINKL